MTERQRQTGILVPAFDWKAPKNLGSAIAYWLYDVAFTVSEFGELGSVSMCFGHRYPSDIYFPSVADDPFTDDAVSLAMENRHSSATSTSPFSMSSFTMSSTSL